MQLSGYKRQNDGNNVFLVGRLVRSGKVEGRAAEELRKKSKKKTRVRRVAGRVREEEEPLGGSDAAEKLFVA